MNVLVVVDMQKDFVDGALGSPEASAIVPAVCEKITNFDGRIIYTRDTHEVNYLQTQEGKNLPVEHCIRGTDGWQLDAEVAAAAAEKCAMQAKMLNIAEEECEIEFSGEPEIIDKPTFGSRVLGERLLALDAEEKLESATVIGLCTDICVISNAMIIKAFMPELPIIVDAACCAGVSPETHVQALGAMEVCQIKIENM